MGRDDAAGPTCARRLAATADGARGRQRVNAAEDEIGDAGRFGEGLHLRQIADGVPGDKFKGLRSLVRETYKGRANTIARTEIRTAQNQASAIRYEASGIQSVDILDGDDDDDVCKTANGSRWSLEYYRNNPIAHPNCTRTATPVIER